MTTTPIINNLAARFALASAIESANASAAATIADCFASFSDDDLDYFPAALNIARTCSAYIESILIPIDADDTACIDAIAELATDDDFILDAETFSPEFLCYFIPNSLDDRPADQLQNEMLATAYNDAFAALDLPLDADIRTDIPADFKTTLRATLTNIDNAFINAHRAIYPNSYNSTDADSPSTITLDPNPYAE